MHDLGNNSNGEIGRQYDEITKKCRTNLAG